MQSSLNSNQLGSLTSRTCLSVALYQRPTSDKTVRLMARDGDKLTLNAQRAVGGEGGGGGSTLLSFAVFTRVASILRWNREQFLDDALLAAKGLSVLIFWKSAAIAAIIQEKRGRFEPQGG